MQEHAQQQPKPPRRIRRPEQFEEAHARGDRDLQALISELQAKAYKEQRPDKAKKAER